MNALDTVGLECGKTPVPESYEAYGCKVNALDPADLFKRYVQAGFLYPAKMEKIAPVMPQILANWRKAMRAGELIHHVVTCADSGGDAWASITSWRSTHTGWFIQHLVSIGNPLASRAVMLGKRAVTLRDGFDHAQQNWFRPANRYANKIFGSIVATLGDDVASVATHQYMAFPLLACSSLDGDGSATVCRSEDASTVFAFATRIRGRVYAIAEELNHEDLLLEAVDDLYQKVGLRRYRRIWLAHLPARDEPAAVAIAYRGPLGFNFSFLENRWDLLVSPDLTVQQRTSVCASLMRAVAPTYADFPLRTMLVTTDKDSAMALTRFGGEFIREYAQGIWLREGLEAWQQHVEKFYERIIRAEHRHGLAAKRTTSNSEPPPSTP